MVPRAVRKYDTFLLWLVGEFPETLKGLSFCLPILNIARSNLEAGKLKIFDYFYVDFKVGS